MSGTGKFAVVLNHSHNNPSLATTGMVVANAAVASGLDTMVFMSDEGARVAMKDEVTKINEAGFSSMEELVTNFIEAGGKVWACSPCVKRRGFTEEDLIEGATIVGGAKLVEFLADGTPSVSY